MAVATPTILPVPTVAARAVASAAKLEISPLPFASDLKISFKPLGGEKLAIILSEKTNKFLFQQEEQEEVVPRLDCLKTIENYT